jgi:integrase
MATISYHLRNAKADEPTPIFMLLYADGKQTKVKTGLRIHPNQWDTQGQKAKTRGKGIAATNGQTNTDLASMGKRAVEFYGQQRLVGRLPTGVEVWEAIKPTVGGVVVEDAPQPVPDFRQWLEDSSGQVSAGTIKCRRNVLKHLVEFNETLRRPLAYADLTREFKDKFTHFLANTKGLADSTLSKELKVLKTFVAHVADLGRCPRIETRGWRWKSNEAEIISLTAPELAAVQALTGLPPHLENTRDLFLLMCLTGLRYSDAVRLRPEHDKGELLQLTAQKTGGLLQVYIRKALRPILNRYWANELRLITNQSMNQFVKELGKRAGIDTLTEVTRHYGQGTQPRKETHPKYKLLGSHSGRRTFVTLSISNDTPADVVMQATGHRNYKTLQRYNQTSATRQVEVSRRVWGEDDNAS